MSPSPDILFLAHPGRLQDWFFRGRSKERAEQLEFSVRLNHLNAPLSGEDWADLLVGVDAVLTTWGSPRLDEIVLSRNSTLKIVGHVGGSVAGIVSAELYERGVRVCTANPLMARTVAEWSLMMTLVGLRRLVTYARFRNADPGPIWEERQINLPPSDAVIGIWGYGDVARRLIELLRPLKPKEIIVSDDFLTADTAAAEGIRKIDLDSLFAQADVIHCLTSLNPANKGRVGAKQLAAIKDGAALLNCGRAALIQEDALIAELRRNRFAAIMDVYESEPLTEGHPFREMTNVILTPHNAGCGRDETYLAAMLDEFDRFFRGEPLQMEVLQERAMVMTDASLMRGRSGGSTS